MPDGYVQDSSMGSLAFYKIVRDVSMKRNEAYIDCLKDGARFLMPKTNLDWEMIQRLAKGKDLGMTIL